jgi:uncharacterized protein (TIGR03118 family)
LAACGGGYGGGSVGSAPAPAVVVAVQPGQIRLGESAQLTWNVTAGAVCTAAGGWTGDRPASGEQRVTPAVLGSISFTLTCHTPAGSGYNFDSVAAIKSVTLDVTPANAFSTTDLASDIAIAHVLDARLVNSWGIAFGPTTTAWVVNNRTNTATLHDGNGHPQPAASPRTVTMPATAAGLPLAPTGIVFNGSADFEIRSSTAAGPARFIFAGRNGSVAAWSPTVDANAALKVLDNPAAEYTGLAIAQNGGATFLYAADFHNGQVDVFDSSFQKITPTATRFAFTDPDLPAGYAPFGIQTLNTGVAGAPQIFVAYAKQQAPDNRDSVKGAGLGMIDVYDTNGQLQRQLILPGGVLNAPWGMTLAPADFGALGNRLLIGNFGDGRINGFGATTGQYSATLSDSRSTPVSISGLWGIAFGNDVNSQPHNTLFYAAGINGETDGTFGRIDLGATPPVLND